jgi:hypothetical protein
MITTDSYLDRYLDPLTEALSPEVAQRILELKPDENVVARVQYLGEKANSGSLTEAERDEYQSLADMGTLVALLKAKARRFLAQHSS